MSVAAGDWVAYWDALGEGQLLFRPEADEYVRNLLSALKIAPDARVLDFGCGYGFVADGLAPRVGMVSLWDAAPSMRRLAADRSSGHRNVRALDLNDPTAVADVRFDLILVNSVVQYMRAEELTHWMARWRGLLAPGGRVVLSDLIPPGHRSWSDILSLLRFSIRKRYFVRALRNTLTERRRYRHAVEAAPLFHVGRDWLTEQAGAAGLAVRFLPRNLTHFSGRYTAVLEPTGLEPPCSASS
jgi:SAM-dependent methyltransferase